MEELLSILGAFYITPHIEDDELLACLSTLYQELTPHQKDLCVHMQELCAQKAFLLGVRTGVDVERFLMQSPAG